MSKLKEKPSPKRQPLWALSQPLAQWAAFFIPQAFGMSLNMTGSPVGAMKVFLIFYIVCVLLTWLVYGRRKFSQK